MSAPNSNNNESITEYVTVTIGDHLFGLPISRVQDVFVPDRLTRLPLAPAEVAGILNLRGTRRDRDRYAFTARFRRA